MDTNDLIDRLYEAALVPELWPETLERSAAVTGSVSGCMLLFEDVQPVRFVASGPLKNLLRQFCESGAWQRSGRVRHFNANPFSGFVLAREYFEAEAERDSPEAELRRRCGLGDQIGTMIPMPTGEIVVFAFDRWRDDALYEAGAIDLLNGFYPHMARAGLIAAQLGLERARSAVSTLEAIGIPAAVLSRVGRVIAANRLLDDISSVLLSTAFGGVAIADRAANDLLRQAIEASASNSEPTVRSIPVKATGMSRSLVIHVLPLRRSAHDIFSNAEVLIAATVMSPSNFVPTPSVLTGLFDLSPSEARLAVALTQGRSLKAFAIETGVTFGTVRKYLDRIYLKTGTHQQSELVSLLKSAHPIM